ncbi:MAG: hypothetical protein PHI40_05805 [Caldisericia bacterium]|nr:hypothetical protein [Caldisericia bacterium]
MTSNLEKRLRKNIALSGLASMAAMPLLGPFAPIAGLASMGILAGVAGRYIIGKDTGRNQNSKENYEENIFPEEPETAIARSAPFQAGNLLKSYSQEQTYQESLSRGYSLAKNLIDYLPQGALDSSTGINITLEKNERSSFFGKETEEYTLKIKIKR